MRTKQLARQNCSPPARLVHHLRPLVTDFEQDDLKDEDEQNQLFPPIDLLNENTPRLPKEILQKVILEACQMLALEDVKKWVANLHSVCKEFHKSLSEEPFSAALRKLLGDYSFFDFYLLENCTNFAWEFECTAQSSVVLPRWDGHGRWRGMFGEAASRSHFSQIKFRQGPLYDELEKHFVPLAKQVEPLMKKGSTNLCKLIDTHEERADMHLFFVQKVPIVLKTDKELEVIDWASEWDKKMSISYLNSLRNNAPSCGIIDPRQDLAAPVHSQRLKKAKIVVNDNEDSAINSDDSTDNVGYRFEVSEENPQQDLFWKSLFNISPLQEQCLSDFALVKDHVSAPDVVDLYSDIFDSIFQRKFLYYTENTSCEWVGFYFLVGETDHFYMGVWFWGERNS